MSIFYLSFDIFLQFFICRFTLFFAASISVSIMTMRIVKLLGLIVVEWDLRGEPNSSSGSVKKKKMGRMVT